MMNKLIIDNRSTMSDFNALAYIKAVIEEGRISNEGKQYCYYTTFERGNMIIGVSSFLNKKSDRFVVTEQLTQDDKGE